MSTADWTPRSQREGVYCSPRCGGGCKKSAYDGAVVTSAKLAARLGDGWEPAIWENLGWHWIVKKGVLEVHMDRDGKFSAWFQSKGFQFIAEAETPEDAIGFVIQDVRTALRRIEAQLVEAV